MKFRRRSRSNVTDIQAARLAAAANGAYNPKFEVDPGIPVVWTSSGLPEIDGCGSPKGLAICSPQHPRASSAQPA
jgi:hypothetical protein